MLAKFQTVTVTITVIVWNLMSVFVTITGKENHVKFVLRTGKERIVIKKNHNVKILTVQVMVNARKL